MVSSTHITTGAALGLAVGSLIPNQAIALPVALIVGIASHHVLDMIPHTDPGSFRAPDDHGPAKPKELWFAWPDNLIGTAFVLWIFFAREASWPMLLGAVGGNLPDVWHNVDAWSHITREKIWPAWFKFHENHHFTARDGLVGLGILTNIVLIIASMWYLLSTT